MRSNIFSNRKSVYLFIITILFIGLSSWGFLVHRTIHQIAIYSLPEPLQSFFYQDMTYLVANSTRPDTRRNADKTEATKHFIDLEAYGPNAANEMPLNWEAAVKLYSKDSLIKYGWVPYLIIEQLDKLTNAFRSKNKDSILFYAADLGLYIGDAHVPLHTSLIYDGQLTGQKGLHSLWESFVPELRIDQYQLYNPHTAKYLKNPNKAIWLDIRKAATLVPELLAIEKEVSTKFNPETKYKTVMRYGRQTEVYTKEFAEAYANGLGSTVNAQLIASANMIADFWYTAWVNAGKPSFITRDISLNLSAELKSFKLNRLIQDELLLSKKEKPEN
jgi:hypothetical protein